VLASPTFERGWLVVHEAFPEDPEAASHDHRVAGALSMHHQHAVDYFATPISSGATTLGPA
jgi:hypothetical protein